MTIEKHDVYPADAPKVWEWLQTRGGLAVWGSLDLSNPGWQCTTPLNQSDGQPSTKPHWRATTEPIRVITDSADVQVIVPKEVKRFHVAVRAKGPMGMTLVVSDGGSRRIRAAVDKASEKYDCEAWHQPDDCDYDNAVIYVPDSLTPISEWVVE